MCWRSTYLRTTLLAVLLRSVEGACPRARAGGCQRAGRVGAGVSPPLAAVCRCLPSAAAYSLQRELVQVRSEPPLLERASHGTWPVVEMLCCFAGPPPSVMREEKLFSDPLPCEELTGGQNSVQSCVTGRGTLPKMSSHRALKEPLCLPG